MNPVTSEARAPKDPRLCTLPSLSEPSCRGVLRLAGNVAGKAPDPVSSTGSYPAHTTVNDPDDTEGRDCRGSA